MKQDDRVTQFDLHAYVDRQLSCERVEEIEAWLHIRPREFENVRQWQRQNDALIRALDINAFNKIPSRLDLPALSVRQRPVYRMIVLSFLLIFSGVLLGWFAHAPVKSHAATFDYTGPAISAFKVFSTEVRHPVEINADQEFALIKWLSRRLNYPLKIPRLDSFGYELIGGRLLAVYDGPAAQIMFENEAGNRITLFVIRSSSEQETAFRYSRERDISMFYWIDKGIGYAIIGKTDRQSLLGISHLVYEQLNSLYRPAPQLPAVSEKGPRRSAT